MTSSRASATTGGTTKHQATSPFFVYLNDRKEKPFESKSSLSSHPSPTCPRFSAFFVHAFWADLQALNLQVQALVFGVSTKTLSYPGLARVELG